MTDSANPLRHGGALAPVGLLALSSPIVLAPGATVTEAAATMTAAGVSAVLAPTAEGSEAIVTEHDLTCALATHTDPGAPVLDIATPHPVMIGVDTPVVDAVTLMLRCELRHLPVVDGSGNTIGILSLVDAVRAMLVGIDLPAWLPALRLALHVEVASQDR